MAKTVKPIAVELEIKGGEKMTALNKSFRDLSKQVKLSDADIVKATQDIVAFAQGAGKSVATLKAQSKALQGLQEQARAGGRVYKKLGEDIRNLKSEIDLLEGSAKSTGKALAAAIPSKTPEKFAQNMRARREQMQGLAADSREYLNALIGITNFERAQGVREQRAEVSAAARAAASGLPRTVANIPLPDTLAGLKQRASELRFEIENLTIGSNEYISANRELVDIQEQVNFVINGSTRAFEELDRAQEGAARRAKKLAGIQQYYGEKAGAGVSGYRDPKTGAIIAPAAPGSGRASLVQKPVREISSLYQSITDIGMQKISANIDMMGNSYAQVAQDIRNATKASNGSINSLNQQKSAWVALRNQLDPASNGYREVTKEIERVDRALEKVNKNRRRMSAGQFAQAAGATISGGIFGGPEGFLGGAIGTAFGGPGGAFAGAAIGAQVGQLRQQIGQYSEMSAEIDRLRLGLAGASNDFSDFVKATQATESASQRLLIPLADSYRIMTQLRANTVELGISVEDTRKIFEGITASVYKTGGGLNEVEGAMRAVIQVLSKGAPQAEELRGQLGERLPAAIIDFAKFTERTPEELADAFQKSEVTLDEFVDFAKNKYDENGQYLDELATNAAYAGLRYEKALERLQLTTGRAFQATGSSLQDFAARWINRIDAIINKALELGIIQKGPSYFVDKVLSGDMTIEQLEDEVGRLGLLAKQAREGWASFDVKERTRLDADAAEQALIQLRRLEKQTEERKKQLKLEKQKADSENRAKSFLAAIEQRENAIAQARLQLEEQAAQIREQAVERARRIEEDIAQQRLNKEREVEDLRRKLAETQADIAFGRQAAAAIAGGADPELFKIQEEIINIAREQQNEKITLERQLLDEKTQVEKAIEEFKTDTAKAILDANENHAKRIGEIQRQYAATTARIIEEGTGRAGKRLEIAGKIVAAEIRKGMAESALGDLGLYVQDGQAQLYPGTTLNTQQYQLARQQIDLYQVADEEIKKLTKELSEIPTASALAAPAVDSISVGFGDLTANATAAANKLERIRDQIKGLSVDLSAAEGLKKLQGIFAGIAAPLGEARGQLSREFQQQRGILRLREEGFSAGAAERIFNIEQQAARQLALATGARDQALRSDADPVEVNRYFAETSDNIRSAAEAARQFAISIESIPADIQLRTSILDTKDELQKLTNPATQIIGIATSIGENFAGSFASVIDGSATAQEALAGFFRNVGKYFLDMAAQIIQKMIVMAILNQLTGLLPGAGAGGGGGDIFADIASRGGLRMENGGVFGKNGIVPFAMGGIVSKPTLFQYANGGTGRFGLMGEAGPEAIMPLRRTSSGRLGVEASGRGGVTVGTINIKVENSGDQLSPAAQKQLAGQVQGIVISTLANERRSGGML